MEGVANKLEVKRERGSVSAVIRLRRPMLQVHVSHGIGQNMHAHTHTHNSKHCSLKHTHPLGFNTKDRPMKSGCLFNYSIIHQNVPVVHLLEGDII